MIIYHKDLTQRDIEIIKNTVDVSDITEDMVIVVDDIAYIAIEKGDDLIIKKISYII